MYVDISSIYYNSCTIGYCDPNLWVGHQVMCNVYMSLTDEHSLRNIFIE